MKTNWLLLTILTILMSCNNDQPNDNLSEVVRVKTQCVEEKEIAFPVHTSGRLSAKAEFTLSFKTGGIISDILVDEGEHVIKGQEMARLDLSEIEAKYQKALSSLEKVERDYERIKSLYKDTVATLEELQNIKTKLEVTRSDVDIAKFNLNHSKIIAPTNGIILKKIKEENEMIGSGHPVFMMGTTGESWVLRVNLTDRDIMKINHSDSAVITFDAHPNKKFSGKITETGNAADPYTGTYEVEITLDPVKEKLVSGLIGTADIYPAKKDNKLTIPIDALVEASKNNGYIITLIDKKPIRKKITIEHMNDKYIIVSGVEKNTVVITDGAKYIDKNSEIKVVND